MAERCAWSDLLVDSCAHCRGITRVEEIEQVRIDEDTLLGVSP